MASGCVTTSIMAGSPFFHDFQSALERLHQIVRIRNSTEVFLDFAMVTILLDRYGSGPSPKAGPGISHFIIFSLEPTWAVGESDRP